MAWTIFMEQSWRKKFSTWPALPLRSSKRSPRLNTLFAKLAGNLSSATVITDIFRTGRTKHRQRHHLSSLRAHSAPVIPIEVEESRCETYSYFHGILPLRFAPPKMTGGLVIIDIEL